MSQTTAGIVSGIILAILLMVVASWFLCDDYLRNKIKEQYDILIWDDHEYMYVVKDRETGQQYTLDFRFYKVIFKKDYTDWS